LFIMTRHRPRRPTTAEAAAAPAPGTTGRYIVRFRPQGLESGTRALTDLAGVTAFSTAEAEGGALPADVDLQEKDVIFHTLGMAVISAEKAEARAVSMAAEDAGIASIRPEMLFYEMGPLGVPPPWLVPPQVTLPISGLGLSPEYLRGCRDMIDFFAAQYAGGAHRDLCPRPTSSRRRARPTPSPRYAGPGYTHRSPGDDRLDSVGLGDLGVGGHPGADLQFHWPGGEGGHPRHRH
jgi:hypothetical protein